MHPCPGNWVAIGHAVVYFARAANTLSAGIKCRHCRLVLISSVSLIEPNKKHAFNVNNVIGMYISYVYVLDMPITYLFINGNTFENAS